MIEMHEMGNPTGDDPFADPYAEQLNYTSAVKNMMDTNAELVELLKRLVNYSERQREKDAPTIIDLSPTSGNQIANTYTTTTRLRIIGFLFTGGSGDQFQLKFGGRTFNFYFVTGMPPFVQFPYSADRGVDISMKDITNSGAVAWSCYLLAYTE